MPENPLDSKIEELMSLREKKAQFKFELDEVTKTEKNLQDEVIQLMEDSELKSIRHKRFGLISIAERIWAKIIPGEFEAVRQYFEREGVDQEIFQLKARSGRLNEFVRDALEKNKMLPKGLDFSPTKFLSIRKG